MNKKALFFSIFLNVSTALLAQTDSSRQPEYYFKIIDSLELQEMRKTGIVNVKGNIIGKYLDKKTKGLNEKGFEKYAEIKSNVYQKFYSDYLFLQSVRYKDAIYVLYFSVAGFDDVEFQILKWDNKDWQMSARLSKTIIDKPDQIFQKVAFNYDEGPKNLDNVRMFIKKDYLVMERGNLFHSLYDLRTDTLLINEESPWHSAGADNLQQMNKWIKSNLHIKIEQKINASR